MKFDILTYNNGVGIVTDAFILKKIIAKNISLNVDVKFINESIIKNSDVGIWIQNFDINLLNRFKKNIFYINEEWSGNHELQNLNLFEYVICKSNYSKQILSNYTRNNNLIHIPFVSRNFFDNKIKKNKKFLHFAGRSIQKNTELILKQKDEITLIDPYNRYKPNLNISHINTYQTEDQISLILNSHNIHVCCSLYESWGHYLFEGLSTGSEIICSDIPVFREQLDPQLIHFISSNE